MFFRLIFLLTFIPLVELYFLFRLSDRIGGANTFALVIFTGIVGAWLLRRQGVSIFMDIQKSMAQGQVPEDALAKGFFTFIGGLLLLTPGIFTDAFGLSLIFPPTQLIWRRYFRGRWQSGIANGNVQFYSNVQGFKASQDFTNQTTHRRVDASVIDVEVKSKETTNEPD